MFCGFDYGTSNCAIGVIPQGADKVSLLPLEKDEAYLPSTLYALEHELICDQVARDITQPEIQQAYIQTRTAQLSNAQRVKLEESITNDEQMLYFGQQAFEQYFALPGEGYFVKSAKSFLGASGVRAEIIYFFEDIVTAMMLKIKQRAQMQCGAEITQTVIGRPVNYQGRDSAKSNAQALGIMETAAKRAGFTDVEFLYEPIAAGLDFERQLTSDHNVLVVDIGGGTSDCAMVRMGPSYINSESREQDFLGHSGESVGGNDFDIELAVHAILPLLGMTSVLKSGLPMPTQCFWDGVRTNNVGAQTQFYKLETSLLLAQLLRDTREPDLLQRFVSLRDKKQNYHLVRSAEQAKIALSSDATTTLSLDYIESLLHCDVQRSQFEHAMQRPMKKVLRLIDEVITQSQVSPDKVYITGGSAKSPLIRAAISTHLPGVELVESDHFGSVASGLTVWAERLYR